MPAYIYIYIYIYYLIVAAFGVKHQRSFGQLHTLADYDRSEGFPRTGYFIPGRDGIGVWQDSRIVVTADSGQVVGPLS